MTPSTKSSSAERILSGVKDGLRTIQNSNSGDVERLVVLLLLLPLLHRECGARRSGGALAMAMLGLSIFFLSVGERERGGEGREREINEGRGSCQLE